MGVLLRASEVAKLPVVTFAGEDVAQIKDVVYVGNGGEVAGFTLNGRGFFAGALKVTLPWAKVVGLGPDAAIIADEDALVPPEELLAAAAGEDGTGGAAGDVLRSQVLTDDGTALGVVVDVVLGIGAPAGSDQHGKADVVGYEIDPAESLGRGKNRLFIPLPDTLAVSGEHLIVPAVARDFVTDDLAGFGAAVDDFRARLRGFENEGGNR
ncbi:PRC-barrel domain containing protein [Nakamurella flava]|uniref:PRC-barrel domain containing protein n=1 Tax=Nakamurella flava TaxID=2576308 RepID=A0A4U6QL28_9ACTN|nr:PRC-barrel domain-containing protein [Nakamurella flava]TKV60999.1 PRC-barrel domain containing protein [Nakamurella flava]